LATEPVFSVRREGERVERGTLLAQMQDWDQTAELA
jgi:hypothetical protein